MTNASPRTTVAATTAPSSENTGPSPPGPNCSASPPARLPNSFMLGLHAATSRWAPQPAPPEGGGSMQGNNSPVDKRTVRHRRKIGADGMAHRRPGAPVDPVRRLSAVVFRTARWRASGRGGTLTTPIFDRSRARPAPSDVSRPLSASIGLCRNVWRRRLKVAHKHAVNASLPIRKLFSAPFATIFHVCNSDR
jgi:hypothetical protein